MQLCAAMRRDGLQPLQSGVEGRSGLLRLVHNYLLGDTHLENMGVENAG